MIRFKFSVARIGLVLASFCLVACSSVSLEQRLRDAPLASVPLRAANIKDGRERFREIFCSINRRIGKQFPDYRDCDDALVRMGGESTSPSITSREPANPKPRTLVFLPGLLGECVRGWADPFGDSYSRLVRIGFRVLVAPLEGRSSSQRNAALLNSYLAEQTRADEELIVIAHSKGAVDFLHATALFPQADWLNQIKAFVSVAGAINGSPIADRYQQAYDWIFGRLPWPDCGPGDAGALHSISQGEQSAWMNKHQPPRSLRSFTLSAVPATRPLNSTLAWFGFQLGRVDPRHDGQLLLSDTFLSNSTFLGVANADHWSVALPFNRSARPIAVALADQNEFPREVLLEAILAMIEESSEPAVR